MVLEWRLTLATAPIETYPAFQLVLLASKDERQLYYAGIIIKGHFSLCRYEWQVWQ